MYEDIPTKNCEKLTLEKQEIKEYRRRKVRWEKNVWNLETPWVYGPLKKLHLLSRHSGESALT
jgi:hypothetical protein